MPTEFCGPMVPETTTLPTEPQPLPNIPYMFDCYSNPVVHLLLTIVVPWFFFPAFVPLLKSFACPRPLSASSSRSGASTRSRTAVGTPSGRAADPQSGKYNSGNDFCSFKLICCPQSISQSTSLKSAAGKTFKTICDRNLRLCYLTDYKITMTQQS